jgi:glycosyltransferase involved in cell wall biosynthesis
LARNFGQTAAIMAGLDHVAGEVIATMDGDGQNDPEDIPILLEKLEEGYDVASGWRRDRHDSLLSRWTLHLNRAMDGAKSGSPSTVSNTGAIQPRSRHSSRYVMESSTRLK